MARYQVTDDSEWFDTNAPTPPAGDPARPTNNSGKPTAAQIAQAGRTLLGRDLTDVTPWLNDPNFYSNIASSQEAKNYAAKQSAGGSGAGKPSAQEFIKNWQQTHPANEGVGPLSDALKANGYTNVSRFMYGSTPSNNELVVDGQKYKVLSGEDSGNPSWYTAGSDDSGGGGGNGSNTQAWTPPAPWSEQFQGPTSADLEGDVGYQEQLKRGQQAIERSAAARGTVLNPGTLKDLSDWSEGTASGEMDKLYARKSQEYGQRYQQYLNGVQNSAQAFGINYGVWNDDVNRFINAQNTAFNQNYSLATLGMNGANGVTNAGSNFANQGGANITGGANAGAAGIVGGANAANQAIQNGVNTGTSLYALSRYGPPRVPTYGAGNPYGY